MLLSPPHTVVRRMRDRDKLWKHSHPVTTPLLSLSPLFSLVHA
jgi:hypothetical protein